MPRYPSLQAFIFYALQRCQPRVLAQDKMNDSYHDDLHRLCEAWVPGEVVKNLEVQAAESQPHSMKRDKHISPYRHALDAVLDGGAMRVPGRAAEDHHVQVVRAQAL